MNKINFEELVNMMKTETVDRPNRASEGTLSGHAAGEPFEKKVYHILKDKYPQNVFKQYEFLNDIFLKHPKHITVEQRYSLFDSPTALFLLSRGNRATGEWSPEHIFMEKQNDTADIIHFDKGKYDLIDVKTRNKERDAQAPNIISAYKLANTCAKMLDNEEYDTIDIDYVEIDWIETGEQLLCVDAHHASLFNAIPNTLYINWAAAMQIQFHVCDVDQSWTGTREAWARLYLRHFVERAEHRIDKMRDKYITPFIKYLN